MQLYWVQLWDPLRAGWYFKGFIQIDLQGFIFISYLKSLFFSQSYAASARENVL